MKNLLLFLLIIYLGKAQAQVNYYKIQEEKYQMMCENGSYDSLLIISTRMNDWALKNKKVYHLEYNKSLFYIGKSYEKNNNIEQSQYYYKQFLQNYYQKKYRNIEYIDFLTHISEMNLNYDFVENAELNIRYAIKIANDSIGGLTAKYAYCSNLLGIVSQNNDTAIKYLTIALKNYMDLGHDYSYERSIVLYNIGSRILDIGNYYTANQYFDSSIKVLNNHTYIDTLKLKQIHYDIAIQYYNKENYKKAIYHFSEVLSLYKKVLSADDSFVVDIRNYLSFCFAYTNDYVNSIKQLKYIHNYLLASNMFSGNLYFENLNNMCGAYYYAQKTDSCISCMHFLIDQITREKGFNTNINYDKILILSEWYSKIGDFNTAIIMLNNLKDSVLKNMPSNHDLLFDIDHNLGLDYFELGQYDIAETIFISLLKSSTIDVKENNKIAKLYNRIGLVYMEMNNDDKSYYYLNKAHNLYFTSQSIIDSSEYILNMISLGVVCFNSKKYHLSKGYYLKCLNIIKQREDNEVNNKKSVVFHNLALLYDALDSFERAEYYFIKCIQIESQTSSNHPSYAESLLAFGEFYFDKKQYKEANKYCDSALCIIQKTLGKLHPTYLRALWLKAEYYAVFNNKERALELFEDFLIANSELIQKDFTWLSMDEKSNYWTGKKYLFKKLDYYLSDLSDSFNKASSLGYNSSLLTKSMLLESSNHMNALLLAQKNPVIGEMYKDMKLLRRQYNKSISENINTQVSNNYSQKADSIDKILTKLLYGYDNFKSKYNVTWLDVQKQLNNNEAAIEFSLIYKNSPDETTYAAYVNRTEFECPKRVLLGRQKEIVLAIEQKNFKELYDLIWLKLDSLLFGIKTIYYSPVGELNNVAFSALCSDGSNDRITNQTYNNRGNPISILPQTYTRKCDNYLIDKYELHQLTSTRYIADKNFKNNNPWQTRISLVGGINYNVIPKRIPVNKKKYSDFNNTLAVNIDRELQRLNQYKDKSSRMGSELVYLPGTKEEVRHIDSMLTSHSWTTKTRTAMDASEQQLKSDWELEACGIIHIATHGFSFPEANGDNSDLNFNKPKGLTNSFSQNPMVRSGLMLSGSNISWTGSSQKMIEQTGEDGILTAAEVANMDLSKTKLVVLSACETGLGKIEGSEGTFGLKRGFKLAGVEQIIVSLWSVPDKETMELMTLFYADLTRTQNPVVSFEKAQKEMRNKYPTEPEKWAGFVLVR